MPFKSSKQKAWMFQNEPRLARKWTEKYGSKIQSKPNLNDKIKKARKK